MKSFTHVFLSTLLLINIMLIQACVDPLYDLAEGVNTEIKVGGDYLAIPLGNTDTIYLRNFLNAEDMEFLKTMEDGGYGITISDSMTLSDFLKNIDLDNLKFPDQQMLNTTLIDFGEMNLDDFVIDGFNVTKSIDINAPSLELEELSNKIELDTTQVVNFPNDYKLDEDKLTLEDFNEGSSKSGILAEVEPFSTSYSPINPEIPFSGEILVNSEELSIQINYEIDVPEGVTNVHQIDLEEGGTLEIEIELTQVTESLSDAKFIPDLTVDPSDLFVFKPDLSDPLIDGKIVFGESQTLNEDNKFKISKSYKIDYLHNLPEAMDDVINLQKDIITKGSFTASGTVLKNKIFDAKLIDLNVRAKLSNLKIKTLDFDLAPFTTEAWNGSSNLEMQLTKIPVEVKNIDTIYFKTSAVLPHKNLIINIKPTDLPELELPHGLEYEIKSLAVEFPENFHFKYDEHLNNQTYSVHNIPLDITEGYTVALDLDKINMNHVPVDNQALHWNETVSYTMQIGVTGRINSDLDTSEDMYINIFSNSELVLESVTFSTNQIDENIDKSEIALAFDIDISEQVKRLDIINIANNPACYLTLTIEKPEMALDLQANQIMIQFSDLFEFEPNPNLNNNAYVINGDIPDEIKLKLKALHINQDLHAGKLSLKDTCYITGSTYLLPGTVNTKDIANLEQEQIIFRATVDNMHIEATSIQLNTLTDSFSDSTVIDMKVEDIPLEIMALDSVFFKPGGKIDLEIVIENMPDMSNNAIEAHLSIQFPKSVIFESDLVDADNKLVITDNLEDCRLFRSLGIRGLALNESNLQGELNVMEKVLYNMDVSVMDPTINSDDLKGEDIRLNVSVNLSGLEFKSVYGKFNVDVGDDIASTNLALDILPEFLRGEDVVLDIDNPIMALNIESNIGIPIDGEISLFKYKEGTIQTDQILKLPFSTPKSNDPNQYAEAYYWFAPKESGKPENYDYIPTDIQNLFNPMPDSIRLDYQAKTDIAVQHIVDIEAYYDFKAKYDITIPFKFGRDFKVALRDTINDVKLGLEETQIKTGTLELLASIKNSIPLDLALELLLMDADLNILAVSPEQHVLAGAPDGSAVVSDITIKLADDLGDLKDLDKIVLVFRASSNQTVAGTPIKPENFIQASLKARILGGINITL